VGVRVVPKKFDERFFTFLAQDKILMTKLFLLPETQSRVRILKLKSQLQ